MEVEPEGSRELLGEEPTERPAVDASHELADEVAVGLGVLADRGARRPVRLGCASAATVASQSSSDAAVPGGGTDDQSGGVGQDVAHAAGRRAPATASATGVVEADATAFDEQQEARARHRLDGRPGVDQRVRFELAGDDVDHRATVVEHGHGDAAAAHVGGASGGVADGLPAGRDHRYAGGTVSRSRVDSRRTMQPEHGDVGVLRADDLQADRACRRL